MSRLCYSWIKIKNKTEIKRTVCPILKTLLDINSFFKSYFRAVIPLILCENLVTFQKTLLSKQHYKQQHYFQVVSYPYLCNFSSISKWA